MQGIADLKGDAIRQCAPRRQIGGSIDEARGFKLTRLRMPAWSGGKRISRWTADAAARIQHPAWCLESSGGGQFFGGRDASSMELVEWWRAARRSASDRRVQWLESPD